MFQRIISDLGDSQGPMVKSVTLPVMTSGSPESMTILPGDSELSICARATSPTQRRNTHGNTSEKVFHYNSPGMTWTSLINPFPKIRTATPVLGGHLARKR